MISLAILALLFSLLFLGVPVGFSMAVSGAVGLLVIGDLDMLAADLMHHVGKDAETGDHRQFLRCRQ